MQDSASGVGTKPPRIEIPSLAATHTRQLYITQHTNSHNSAAPTLQELQYITRTTTNTMASGMGMRGTMGRCYGFFADYKDCTVSEDDARQCHGALLFEAIVDTDVCVCLLKNERSTLWSSFSLSNKLTFRLTE